MTDINECHNPSCSNTFDLDNDEGVIMLEMIGGIVPSTPEHYCCVDCRDT